MKKPLNFYEKMVFEYNNKPSDPIPICPVCGSNQVQFKDDYPDEVLIGDFDYYCFTCEIEGRKKNGFFLSESASS